MVKPLNMDIAIIREPKFQERFWRRVNRDSGCWIWVGQKNHQGYGQVELCREGNRRMWTAHRVAWAIQNDSLPPQGSVIMHLCDNPSCCRPDHLKPGTQSENTRDALHKGRMPRTAAPEIRREALRLRAEEKMRVKDIAAKFGLRPSTVTEWLWRQRWGKWNYASDLASPPSPSSPTAPPGK